VTRSTVCYLVNTETKAKIAKYDDLFDCQREKHKMNKKEGKKVYACKPGWVVSKLQ
jgi:hypothetical protein